MKTKNEEKHTPTPKNMAVVDHNSKGAATRIRFVIEADSNIPGHRCTIGAFQYKPHAEMFVRAVNSHEALLKAAKIGLNWTESEQGSDHSESDFIKKAIAQAEGE